MLCNGLLFRRPKQCWYNIAAVNFEDLLPGSEGNFASKTCKKAYIGRAANKYSYSCSVEGYF